MIPLHLGLRQIFQAERPMTEAAKAEILEQIDGLAEEVGGLVRPQSVLQDVLQEAVADVENASDFPVESRLTKMLTGREVFVLHDTFGFPRELTEEIVREKGLEVDEEGFGEEVDVQRARARAARDIRVSAGPVNFSFSVPEPQVTHEKSSVVRGI